MESVIDGDGFNVEDGTNGALWWGRPKPNDITVKFVYLLDLLLRLVHQIQVLPALSAHLFILLLALGGLGQPSDIVTPYVDRASEVADRTQHARDSFAVALVSEHNDLLGSLAVSPARHARVGERGRRTSDVGSGEEDCALVGAADAEV